MAYTKTNNNPPEKDIKYLDRDFNSYKQRLIEFSKTYFPNTFNDFSEGSPGMMFIEMAAYVGDVLSFYQDTQLQETFLLYAQEKENLYQLAYSLGYRPKVTNASSVNLDIFQLVPSVVGVGGEYKPDYNYALVLDRNSSFNSSESSVEFLIQNKIDFNFSSSSDTTEVSVYQINSGTNQPDYYLLKKSVMAISAKTKTENFEIGSVEKFLSVNLIDVNIIGIEGITDSDDNIWYEVPYLAQDTIFEEVSNNEANDPTLSQYNNEVPYLLRLKRVPRRFVTRLKSDGSLDIQFGSGTNEKADEEIIPNPDNVGEGIKDGRNKLDISYDPSNFLFTGTYGVSPSTTTLTVTYLTGGGISSNVGSNTITENGTLRVTNKPNLNGALLAFVKNSIVATNPEAATGGGSGDTVEDIRLNAMANFSAQQRIVNKNDYMVRTLSMPSQFGKVAKVYVTQDDQISPLLTSDDNQISNPLALNLYTLGYDINKKLTPLSLAAKENLKTYLEQYRMLTDAINIKNAFPINLSIDFEITVFKKFNNQTVLLECIKALKSYFNIDRWQVNQPIIISELWNLIGGVVGVQTVEKVGLQNEAGAELGYSQYKYDFETATKNGVIYPSLDPAVFEIKHPNSDIKGKVVTY